MILMSLLFLIHLFWEMPSFILQRALLLLKTEANEMHLCKWATLFITLSYAFLFSFARTKSELDPAITLFVTDLMRAERNLHLIW